MGQEHEELIRRAYEAANAGDLEAASALADPEIELRTRFTAVAGRPYHGHEGIGQWLADLHESWEQVDQAIDRFIEIDEERTISVIHFRGRGKGSGIEIDQEIATLWTVRGGKIVAVETHGTLEETLAAAGVEQ